MALTVELELVDVIREAVDRAEGAAVERGESV